MMDIHQRVSILKQHEIECYRICFYLLQSEKMARETAKDALIKLFKQEMFFALEVGARTELLRKQSIKSALEAKVLEETLYKR